MTSGNVTHWRNHKRAILALGGECVVCGETDLRILQINHLNGGGRKEMNNGRNSHYFYRDIINGTRTTDDLDVRCANCNILYEYEVGRRKEHSMVLQRPRWTQKEIEHLIKEREKGTPWAEIDRQLGRGSAASWLKAKYEGLI